MIRVKTIATACAAVLASLTVTVAAQDSNWNERTHLTFSSAVELPGVTLQPGTYLFKLADSQSNRHIVQVFNQEEREIIATILAVPAERQEVTGETVVTFRETAENTTPAVQYWYYPGDRIGHEFVYPKDQAMRIAQRTGQNVLTMDGDVASAGSTVTSTGPDGRVSEWKREEATAPAQSAEAQSGAVTGTAGATTAPEQTTARSEETVSPSTESNNPETETPPAEPAAAHSDARGHSAVMPEAEERAAAAQSAAGAANDARGHSAVTAEAQERAASAGAVGTSGQASELPRTASPLPLAGLLGLLSLGAGLMVRRARR